MARGPLPAVKYGSGENGGPAGAGPLIGSPLTQVSLVIGGRIGGPWPFSGADCQLGRCRLVKAGDQSHLSYGLAVHVEVTVRRIRPPSSREEKCPAGLIVDRHPGTCLNRSVGPQIIDGRRHEA